MSSIERLTSHLGTIKKILDLDHYPEKQEPWLWILARIATKNLNNWSLATPNPPKISSKSVHDLLRHTAKCLDAVSADGKESWKMTKDTRIKKKRNWIATKS